MLHQQQAQSRVVLEELHAKPVEEDLQGREADSWASWHPGQGLQNDWLSKQTLQLILLPCCPSLATHKSPPFLPHAPQLSMCSMHPSTHHENSYWDSERHQQVIIRISLDGRNHLVV